MALFICINLLNIFGRHFLKIETFYVDCRPLTTLQFLSVIDIHRCNRITETSIGLLFDVMIQGEKHIIPSTLRKKQLYKTTTILFNKAIACLKCNT